MCAGASVWLIRMQGRLFRGFSLAGMECTALFTGWMTYHLFLFLLLFFGAHLLNGHLSYAFPQSG